MNFIYGNYIKKLRLTQKVMNEDGRLLPSRKELSRILQDFRRVRARVERRRAKEMERRQAARVLNMKSESAMRRSRRFGLILYENRVFPSGGFPACPGGGRGGDGKRG